LIDLPLLEDKAVNSTIL